MSEAGYLQRNCPCCGSSSLSDAVSSNRKGEALAFGDLRPFWSGFFKEKVFFTYRRCAQCGLLYAPSFFTLPQLDELYAEMAPNMDVVTSDAIVATQRGYYQEAAQAATPGGYLEIGPDVGHIVGHAARSGQFDRFWLYEPNRSVHEELVAATLGKPHAISTEMTDLSAVPDGSVGLAIMVHVLDHLLEPIDMLEQIRAKLKPGGALVTVTHNERSLLRYIMGTRWPPFCLQHPEVYNPRSIEVLMRRAGFGDVKVKRSRNVFPLDFMVKQAAWTAGIKLDGLDLPKWPLGLRLGNILTIARVN